MTDQMEGSEIDRDFPASIIGCVGTNKYNVYMPQLPYFANKFASTL